MALLPLFAMNNRFISMTEVRTFILLIIITAYLTGMLRSKGVDIPNYRYAFDIDPNFIPDPGFSALIRIFSGAGLPFWSMMITIGIINLLVIARVARAYKVDVTLLLFLWFIHLAVVRDFAQLRIGLAASLAVLGACTSNRFGKLLFYLLGASMHYTAVAFVAAFEVCAWVSRRQAKQTRAVLIAGLVLLVLAVGGLLQKLAFLDPRIELYLKWEQAGYGSPIDSFGSLLLHLIVLAIALMTRTAWSHDPRMRTIFYLQIAGITAFIALSQVAIFAFRISNVILSLYPVLVLKGLTEWRPTLYGRSVAPLAAGTAVLIFASILIMRPGSLEIIQRVRF